MASVAEAEGIGLHTGVKVRFWVEPAEADTGIVFVRTDLPDAPRIAATPGAVNRSALQRRTELVGDDGATIATPEHLLAACLGMGIDNVCVEVDGPELPIFDGSVLPFVDLLRRARPVALDAPRSVWTLRRPVTLSNKRGEISALPADRMRLIFFADLVHAGIPNQTAAFAMDPDAFVEEVAPARTFVFYEDVVRLRQADLIRGGSLECALVLREGRPINGEYRLGNELAAHKLLDLMGDLAILGRPVRAMIAAHATGHAMHHEFIELLEKELIE